MLKWVLKGLRTGVRTTVYPLQAEPAPGASPIVAHPNRVSEGAGAGEWTCPAGVWRETTDRTHANYGRCVHCFQCGSHAPGWEWWDGYEWAYRVGEETTSRAPREKGAVAETPGAAFRRSLHIRVFDGGACGACLSEIRQVTKPHYNMHRLGFFVTPTPRQADVLLVAGPVTDNLRLALEKTYAAMPAPKAVIAAGACALGGGVFGPSFAAAGGIADILPVDVAVPGCPPPPLAILHALLVLTGRAEESCLAPSESPAKQEGE